MAPWKIGQRLCRWLGLACAVTVVFVMSASASAMSVQSPSGRPVQPEQNWASRMQIGPPALTVTLIRKDCPQPYIPGARGVSCVMPDGLTMYLSPKLTNRAERREIFYHELGHVYDLQDVAPRVGAVRARFLQLNGLSGDWHGPTGVRSMVDTPVSFSELFAEAFGYCASYGPRDWRWFDPAGEYGWWPGRVVRSRTCAMLRRNVA